MNPEPTKSVFDSDIDSDVETTFDVADVVFAINRVSKEVQVLTFTVAFATGVLIYMATRKL